MIWKTIVGIAVGFTILIFSINWFLSPDGLVDCGDTPSENSGCNAADVIIAVSGGDTTARTQQAIDLYKKGWAPKLIFSGAALDKSGPSNAKVMRDQALLQGVPSADIIIEEASETTEQNAKQTGSIISRKDIRSAIVVTSAYHMKRTLVEFRHQSPDASFRPHPVSSDDQWSVWWWTTPYGWYLAVSEIIKIVISSFGGSS